MGPYVDSVTADEVLPKKADVVVIGGGIIGTSAALALASRGLSVVLCEKGHIAGEQSSRNAGWCRQAGRDEREMPLIIESLRMWRSMNRTVEAETGFSTCGVLYTGETAADEASYERWIEMAGRYQVAARLVKGAELQELMPGATRAFRCGMFVPSDGRAEPQKSAPAIARAAQRAGAAILAHCAVRGLQRTAGRVSGVVTERGTIACTSAILASGAWTSLFCASLGIRLPQLKLRASLLRTEPVADGPEVENWTPELCYRKRHDGGYTIGVGAAMLHKVPIVPDSFRYLKEFTPMLKQNWRSLRPQFNAQSVREFTTSRTWQMDQTSPFERTRVLEPAADRAELRTVKADMARLFPAFAETATVQEWAGYIDVTPDAIPYIGPAETVPGLVVAAGFSGHGFGIGPAAGRLAADLATNAPPIVDPTPYRLSRFADGSPIDLGPEV